MKVDGSSSPPTPARSMGRSIAVLLAVKVVVLTIIYATFFAPSHRPPIDPAAYIGGAPSRSR